MLCCSSYSSHKSHADLRISSSHKTVALLAPEKQITTAPAGTSSPRNPLGTKKAMEETVVGIDRDVELIRDKLVEEQKHLDVVPIVGMGGVGKTTLATKVFNDPFVVYHFHVRAWVTVSQSYNRHDLLIQILQFIGVEFDPKSEVHSKLREKLHKTLMDRRYLIVADDMWCTKAWDDLKLFFPNNDTGSRILLTSRLKKVALHAKSHGLIHQLNCLTDKKSWELLCKKVFHGNDCPKSLIKPGIQIAQNCHGLPLAVVVIAGILGKEAAHKDSWERVGQMVSSYITNDENGLVDILGLSYEHLPAHLKDCFLYLGGFPEDHKFGVQKLIWLWIAEGFVQEDGNRSLEEIGEDYMMELVYRNLVVVVDRKFNGAIKTCLVHDLLRELCLERARKGNFWLKINMPMSSQTVRQYKPHRIFTHGEFLDNNVSGLPSPWVRSLLCVHNSTSFINITKGYFRSYPLLMVLDLQSCQIDFPRDIRLLVHLRYLAFWCKKGFPSLICNLWSLHTLIARSRTILYLPKAISNLVNLRHFWSDKCCYFPFIEKPMNLQTISEVALLDEAESWKKSFPAIKELNCRNKTQKNDFESLHFLETLKYGVYYEVPTYGEEALTFSGNFQKIHITFPASLKELSLRNCRLPWRDMSIIQSLPNLEVLILLDDSFLGCRWKMGKVLFRQLKYLKFQGLNILHWEASSINFPCLKHLLLDKCRNFKKIPPEIGDIPTLELIDIVDSRSSVVKSLDEIREEQQNFGNYDLKINVRQSSNLHSFRKLEALISLNIDGYTFH